ncbi:hypothetical protein [Streptomyces sp. NPDC001410]|uniref:hypothetical protein n=1 Tax=Streptomyces sp. NPDC001410 TaxID=3364574 RepID=UPI0036BF488F
MASSQRSLAQDNTGRYHLLLSTSGQPVQHGWWESEDVARDKLLRWIGSVGSTPEPSVPLTDEETGRTLTIWSAKP